MVDFTCTSEKKKKKGYKSYYSTSLIFTVSRNMEAASQRCHIPFRCGYISFFSCKARTFTNSCS